MNTLQSKIATPESLKDRLGELKRPIVFTNGCFDILHRGHVAYLEKARQFGQSMIVGVNSDVSVRRLNKGPNRPFNTLDDRMAVLAALAVVDLVVPFDQDTPLGLIKQIIPDHLVKGGDWELNHIVGADVVKNAGGQIHSIPIEFPRSTTDLIKRI
ncbi:MAG: D-glycero-beta-D-manno-heptose 1-phosphate adenylyltransferase, partial [Arenicellales bacterium]|nr:D-glycero-beta-D-manno-heptose 1-phosphate adenylyltransferase [Arenicellales bacterium]